jgi:hypothetical protein
MIKEIVLKDLNVPKAPGAPESIGVPVPPSVELHDMTPTLAEKGTAGQGAQILPHRACDCACERQRPQGCGRNQNCGSEKISRSRSISAPYPLPWLNQAPGGAILPRMKVEEIAEAIAKLPPVSIGFGTGPLIGVQKGL